MPTFQPHKITFTAETTLRGDEIKEYVAKKLDKGRLRLNPDTFSVEQQKKPHKEADGAEE